MMSLGDCCRDVQSSGRNGREHASVISRVSPFQVTCRCGAVVATTSLRRVFLALIAENKATALVLCVVEQQTLPIDVEIYYTTFWKKCGTGESSVNPKGTH